MEVVLKDEDLDRIKKQNIRNAYGLSYNQLVRLVKKYKRSKESGDEYTCALIEYRLSDINSHSDVGWFSHGKYNEGLSVNTAFQMVDNRMKIKRLKKK